MNAFFITFRESLEAGVIVGILFATLRYFQSSKKGMYLWAGVAAGIACSFLFAAIFTMFLGGFEGKAEKLYEGILMIGAAGLITHMVFWMKAQGRQMSQNFKQKIDLILQKKTLIMLSSLSFFAVVREGIETVIFLNALQVQSGQSLPYVGASIGIILAVALSYAIYKSSQKMSAVRFFKISSFFLIAIAAGLLAHGIVELQGAGLLPIIQKPLYDLSALLPESDGLGLYLKTLFGYDANPSLIAVMTYILFLGIVGRLYGKKAK